MRLVSDAIRSRYRSILLFALVGTALAGIAAWAWPQTFTSTADVMLTPAVGNALAPDSARSGDQINVAMQTEAALIVSPPVAALVSEEVGYDVEPGDVGVTATVLPNTQIIRIEYSADTADAAVDMADAYASALLEYRRSRTEDDVNGQLEVLAGQQENASAGLKQASIDATGSESLEASGMVQLYTNRLAAIQEKMGTLEATPRSPGSVTSPASRPTSSDGIPALLLIPAGLVLAILLGCAYAITREWGDDRIRASLVGRVEGYPVMGVVPSDPPDLEHVDAEGYRTIRATLLASAAPPSTIVIAPIDVSLTNGAQQVALGTAAALTASGYKTCLIDASLVAGPISREHGADRGIGLASVLSTGSIEGAAQHSHRGFDVLLGGETTAETRELLGSARIRTVLADLSRQYDFILVAAPDLGSAEAAELALATPSNGVILVAAERRTTGESIRRVTGRIEQLGIGFLGLVAVKNSGTALGLRAISADEGHSAAPTEPSGPDEESAEPADEWVGPVEEGMASSDESADRQSRESENG